MATTNKPCSELDKDRTQTTSLDFVLDETETQCVLWVHDLWGDPVATNTTPFAFKLVSVILDYLEVKCVAKFMWRPSEIVPLFLSSRKTTPRICKCLGCWLAHVERQCWLAQILAPQILRCWRQLETNAHAPRQLNCHNWRIDSELTNRAIVTSKGVAFQ